MTDVSVRQAVDEVFKLFETYGNADYIGESISQLEHACQAAQMAEKESADPEVVLAALFHDIGHLCEMNGEKPNMGGYGVMEHEQLGADFLRARGFSEKVVKLVQSHVQAKRYLCFSDGVYHQNLSEASKKTLEYQGGAMSAQEAVLFERDPLFNTIIRMRLWDEMAKHENRPLPEMEHYKQMAVEHLRTTQ